MTIEKVREPDSLRDFGTRVKGDFAPKIAFTTLVERSNQGRRTQGGAAATAANFAVVAPFVPARSLSISLQIFACTDSDVLRRHPRFAFGGGVRLCVASGAFLSTLGKNDEARAAMLRALELSPNNPSATMNLAELEFSAGRFEQATGYHSKLPIITANTALVSFRLYICYEKTGRADKAQALIRAGKFRSQSAEDFFIRAAEVSERGDEGEARRLVTSAELLFGEKAKAYQASLKKIGWLK